MLEFSPAFPLIIAALVAGFTRGRVRAVVMLAAPILSGLNLMAMDSGLLTHAELFGLPLTPVRVDKLSMLFGILFHIAAFIGVIYALNQKDPIQDVAALSYAGSAVGAVFAGDLLTLFVYWELLALTSVFLILARRTPRALAAGLRYLIMQVGSGVLLLVGVLVMIAVGHDISFNYIGLDAPGGLLIFLAFGVKSAFPLLHNWLTDGYPEATPVGTVFLSAFTTKVAVYSLARGFAGTEILVYIGALMTCFPIFYAVIENDLRRVLAYSMINQIGFMVVGVGIGTELALNGAVAHAFNDVLFKGLLMMSMGAVLHVTGEMRGSELGGLYKKMPKTAVLCMVGAASISAFPLFSGFVSKSMVVAAALKEGYNGIWLMLLFAAAGVFHHAGIKIPFFAFFYKDSKFVKEAHEAPTNMLVAMGLAATLCIGIGCFPGFLYDLLPYNTDFTPYDVSHVLSQLQLLAFSALAFTWLKLAHIYPPELKSINVDAEWLYRWVLPRWTVALRERLAPTDAWLRNWAVSKVFGGIRMLKTQHDIYGAMARAWPIGNMVMWVAVLLGAMLISFYM
ncbi:MAG: Na(+)/H(+) antiporter subunit D [Magnetococcales bacterium]|nr:Na(+)/H(+) antiporter subunit D [Magnetococcales bacterium]